MNEIIITKQTEGSKLTVAVEGRVDTKTAPQLENEVFQSLDGVTELLLDLAGTSYISSAGLRVLLALYKIMHAKNGTYRLCNVNDTIRELIELTGLTDFLTIE